MKVVNFDELIVKIKQDLNWECGLIVKFIALAAEQNVYSNVCPKWVCYIDPKRAISDVKKSRIRPIF